MYAGGVAGHIGVGREQGDAMDFLVQAQGVLEHGAWPGFEVQKLEAGSGVTGDGPAIPKPHIDSGFGVVAADFAWRIEIADINHHEAAPLGVVGQIGAIAVVRHVHNCTDLGQRSPWSWRIGGGQIEDLQAAAGIG